MTRYDEQVKKFEVGNIVKVTASEEDLYTICVFQSLTGFYGLIVEEIPYEEAPKFPCNLKETYYRVIIKNTKHIYPASFLQKQNK